MATPTNEHVIYWVRFRHPDAALRKAAQNHEVVFGKDASGNFSVQEWPAGITQETFFELKTRMEGDAGFPAWLDEYLTETGRQRIKSSARIDNDPSLKTLRATIIVMVSEISRLTTRCNELLGEVGALRTALALGPTPLSELSDRTNSQAKTAIMNEIESGNAD